MKFLYLTLLAFSSVFAQDIPNPLTLEHALKIGQKNNTNDQKKQLAIDSEKITLDEYKASFEPNVDLDVQLAKRDYFSESTNNSYAFINIEQTLFEKKSDINIKTQKQKILSIERLFTLSQKEKDINIMRSFFDIILADMELETTLEALAISAIRAANIKDSFDIKHASEVELLEKQAKTELDVSKRIKAQAKQITTRAKLAQLLNISYENRPDELIKPDLDKYFLEKIADFETLQKKAFKNNITLNIKKNDLLALDKQISSKKNDYGLVVKANARLGEQAYFRDKNGKWRIGLNFNIPLGSNDENKREINKLTIQRQNLELDISEFKNNLNQKLLTLWLKLGELKQLKKSLTTKMDYHDLYLERARANYEMEIKSDIGNAMTNFTHNEYELTENEFDYVVTLEKLNLLTGE